MPTFAVMKKILVIAATHFEIQPFINFLKEQAAQRYNPLFGQNGYEIDVVVSGVGIASTALKMGKALASKRYDFALNAGVAGSFNRKIGMGDVVEVISEQYGDLGVEEADGKFSDMFEIGLMEKNEKPFNDGKLLNIKPLQFDNMRQVRGMTVQKVHGFTDSIEAVQKKYQSDIETMEGAAFFQACLSENVSFSQIRAISNYIEPRNRNNWQMKEAIIHLNTVLMDIFEKRAI
jgi:futalosine hydrolase